MFKSLSKRIRRAITPRRRGSQSAPSTLKQACAELVERARQGDQNAIGTIKAVADAAARKQNPRVVQSAQHIMEFIKANPVVRRVSFGEEIAMEAKSDALAAQVEQALSEHDYCAVVFDLVPKIARHSVNKAIVTLSHGPNLLNAHGEEPRIKTVADKLEPPQRKAYSMGVKYCENAFRALEHIPPECRQALVLGYILGCARRLQAVRIPNAPIVILCPNAAWELGE